MTTALVVPIHVDALCLDAPLRVVGPSVDLPGLPWFDGTHDRNPAVPGVARYVHNEPFADHGLLLSPGVHLHWALPDGLTRGSSEPRPGGDQLVRDLYFPAAPDRWLVTRRRPGEADRVWLVESDRITPPDDDRSIADDRPVPYPAPGGGSQFLRLGRQTDLIDGDWAAGGAAYLADLGARLTAVGHGDPAFAALYANCRSIFGAHDPDPVSDAVTYDVVGWYADAAADPLAAFAFAVEPTPEELVSRLNTEPGATGRLRVVDLTDERAAHARALLLGDAFGWTLDDAAALPGSLVCAGRVAIDPTDPGTPVPAAPLVAPVTVGSSSAEALAALVGDAVGGVAVERVCEALRLAGQVRHHTLDLGVAFDTARHRASFRPVVGERAWAFRPDPDAPGDGESVAVPPVLTAGLQRLMAAQQRYDRAAAEVDARRHRVFDDWYRLMVATYARSAGDSFPADVNALRGLLERELAELEAARAVTGVLDDLPDPIDDGTLAGAVGGALGELLVELAARPEVAAVVAGVPGTQFFAPLDPVLAINHPLARPSRRHGSDGRADPRGVLVAFGAEADVVDRLRHGDTGVAGPLAALVAGTIGDTEQGLLPWNPLLVEWRCRFHAVGDGGNHSPGRLGFEPDFLLRSHRLPPGSCDLVLDGDAAFSARHELVDGRAFFSPDAATILRTDVADFLAEPGAHPATDTLTAVAALLDHDDMAPVAFPLGGFTAALRAHRAEPQLEIADPLGFPEEQELARRVRDAVGRLPVEGPDPSAPFHPLRTGELDLDALRIIDTFGRTAEIHPASVVAAQTLADATADRVGLPPRFTQPARLGLRWTSAADPDVEAGPGATPVCGWLVPDHVDHVIAVYAADGELLGQVDPLGRWLRAPGPDVTPAVPAEIDDPRLRQVVEWMTGQGADPAFVPALSESLETALESVDVRDPADHAVRAFLLGRPVAVLGARLDLTLLGLPATAQSWTDVALRLAGGPPDDHGFPAVRVPVRIGEPDRAGDGTVGFWVRDAGGVLHVPRTAPGEFTHPAIEHSAEPMLTVAVADPPLDLTVLMDPRAAVHATCGLLPVRSVTLPPEHYRAALAAMRTTFLAAPVLTPPGRIAIELPDEAGTTWSWLAREGPTWTETPAQRVVRRTAFDAAFPTGADALWSDLVTAGWLVDATGTVARLLLPEPDRPPLPGRTEDETVSVTRSLIAIAAGLDRPALHAEFDHRPVAVEGWLQLRTLSEPQGAP